MKLSHVLSLIAVFAAFSAKANEPSAFVCSIVSRVDDETSSLAQKLLDEFKEVTAIELCFTASNNEAYGVVGLFASPDIGNFKVLEVRNLSAGRIRRALGRKLPPIYADSPAEEKVRFQVCEKVFDCEAFDTENYFRVRNMTRNELSQTLNEWTSIKSRSNLEIENQEHIYRRHIRRFERNMQDLTIIFVASHTRNTGEIIVQIHLARPNYKRKWILYLKREGNSFKLEEVIMTIRA